MRNLLLTDCANKSSEQMNARFSPKYSEMIWNPDFYRKHLIAPITTNELRTCHSTTWGRKVSLSQPSSSNHEHNLIKNFNSISISKKADENQLKITSREKTVDRAQGTKAMRLFHQYQAVVVLFCNPSFGITICAHALRLTCRTATPSGCTGDVQMNTTVSVLMNSPCNIPRCGWSTFL